MCGRYNVTDDPAVHRLFNQLGVDTSCWQIRFSPDITPASIISIIRDDEEGERRVDDAIWCSLLEASESGWRPNTRYASFNSRYDKLNNPGSLVYYPYRASRCIIPASGFIEGLEGTKSYHLLEGADQAIAFGGLYRAWTDQETGEQAFSASIITLPPHPKFAGIHEKAFPMMLDVNNQAVINQWLSSTYKDIDQFEHLLKAQFVVSLTATPIDRPSKKNKVGDQFVIAPDI